MAPVQSLDRVVFPLRVQKGCEVSSRDVTIIVDVQSWGGVGHDTLNYDCANIELNLQSYHQYTKVHIFLVSKHKEF